MKARVMISSVLRDRIPVGRIEKLAGVWNDWARLPDRLRAAGIARDSDAEVSFAFLRQEIERHLQNKYGFHTYIFEEHGGAGASPAKETVLEAERAQLVIGIYGSTAGWKVPDQDPLSPTLREWRAALQFPLKFRLFWLNGSKPASEIPGPLGEVLREIADYKAGKVYSEFSDMTDLFLRIDRSVQDYVQRAVVRYVADTVTKEPASETEDWLLSPFRERVQKMTVAFAKVATSLGVHDGDVLLGDERQPVSLHCIPDSFSVAESRKFAAYAFEEEGTTREVRNRGKLHIIAAFAGVTDGQVRRHLGNFEAARVYKGPWGFFASKPNAEIQCIYLPNCTSSLAMQARLPQALDWVQQHGEEVAALAKRRQEILDILGEYTKSHKKPVRATRRRSTEP